MRFIKGFLMGLGSLALIGTFVVGLFFLESRRPVPQNFAPTAGVQATSPNAAFVLVSEPHGDSSFLVRDAGPSRPRSRLTSVQNGIESEASFSHNGKLVTYSYASSPSSGSTVWIVGARRKQSAPRNP